MGTNNSINASDAGLVRYNGTGSYDAVTVTNHAALVGAASNGITSIADGTSGQLFTSNGTGADPSWQDNKGLSNWIQINTTSRQMANNTGYIANNAAEVGLTLPATASQGSTIKVLGKGAGGWGILQNSGQTIYFGDLTTTTGLAGGLASTKARDSITLICVTQDTEWQVTESIGNIIVI